MGIFTLFVYIRNEFFLLVAKEQVLIELQTCDEDDHEGVIVSKEIVLCPFATWADSWCYRDPCL